MDTRVGSSLRSRHSQGVDALEMRIGIHVGPLTAGVIGTKRLRYDIWGTALNTAVQLESSGLPNEVCVSEDVLRYLDGAFRFHKHQRIKLKAALKDGSDQIDSFRLERP